MAQARDAARTYGKSDPIDALAVARAALRHADLPVAQLDGEARELRLLVDHREDLVAERTRCTTGCGGIFMSSTWRGIRRRGR
jgi:transposase